MTERDVLPREVYDREGYMIMYKVERGWLIEERSTAFVRGVGDQNVFRFGYIIEVINLSLGVFQGFCGAPTIVLRRLARDFGDEMYILVLFESCRDFKCCC